MKSSIHLRGSSGRSPWGGRAAAMLGLVLTVYAAQGAVRQTLSGHVPVAARGMSALSRLPAATNLNLAITLPLRNQAALTNLLRDLYNPASPNYRHFITPQEFAVKFGPTEQDYQELVRFAESNGLRVRTRHPNRVVLDVTCAAAEAEKAFHVTLRTYRHPVEARDFFAPDTEPALDLSVPVVGISGLDDYALPRPRLQVAALPSLKAAQPRTVNGSGPGGAYLGNDFRAAYLPGVTLTGAGQSVGLLQFDGYNAADITNYAAQAGLPDVPLVNVLLDGVTGEPSGNGGEVEVSLDIQMAISMAPGLDRVIVYEGRNWSSILNRMATDNLAAQLSCSWYQPGKTADPVVDAIFQQMAAQGQSFYNASGDNDAFTGQVDFPSESPYITQVGGTTLTTDGPGGSRVSETVWNRGNGIGSGGGIGTYYDLPDWQQDLDLTASQGSKTRRNIPDVALTAENIYVRANQSNYTVGGTSCSAPLWAGLTALMNQLAGSNGMPPVGLINQQVYACGKGGGYTSAFYDITTGNNERPGSTTKFTAVTGYDLCTGWGTPAGTNLLNAIALPEVLLRITPGYGCVITGQRGGPFTPAAVSYTLTGGGSQAVSWKLGGQPAWLTASVTNGTIATGDEATKVTLAVTAAANALNNGKYSATVWFTNLTDQTVQRRQFTLAVGLDRYTCVTNADGTLTITGYAGPGGDVVVPDTIKGRTVTVIEYGVFDHNTSLTSVTIPDSVTDFRNFVFSFSTSLTRVMIGKGLTNLGFLPFNACYGLNAITVNESNTAFSSLDGVLFDKGRTELITYPKGKQDSSYLVPNSVTRIGTRAFPQCQNLTSVTLGDSVISIGRGAFWNCANLTSCKLGESVTTIENGAFAYCYSLSSMTFPNSVTNLGGSFQSGQVYQFLLCTGLTNVMFGTNIASIGYGAFAECYSLASMTPIPASVTYIGNWAFGECNSLDAIPVDPNNPAYSSLDGVLFNKDQIILMQYPNGKAGSNYSVLNSVTNIDSLAFGFNTHLVNVNIPASVVYITDQAFRGCPWLATVLFEGNVPYYSWTPFMDSTPTLYYTAGTTGWSNSWWGCKALPAYPGVAIAGPVKNAGAIGNPALTISGTAGLASDKTTLTQVLVGLDDGPVTNVATLTGTGGTNTTWTYAWTPQPGAGNHTVVARALGEFTVFPEVMEGPVASNAFLYHVYVPLAIVTNTDGRVSSAGGRVTATRKTYGTPTNGAQLELGRTFTLTAVAAPNNLFSNWTAVVGGATNFLTAGTWVSFPMQSNLAMVASFVTNYFMNAAGNYYGLFSDTNGIGPLSAGFIKVTVTGRPGKPGRFSGSLLLAGERGLFSGTFDLGGDAAVPLAFTMANVTLRLHLPQDGSDIISGSVSNSDGSWTASLWANRAVYKTTAPATAYAGQYTLVIPGSTNAAAAPGGDGYGLVKVTKTGSITVAGSLGDGALLKQTVPVSRWGAWPFYSPASRLTGTNASVIMGWLSFSNGLNGSLTWVKPALADEAYYPDGFELETEVMASRYDQPGTGVRAIPLSSGSGSFLLTGGNLTGVWSNTVALSTLNKFSAGTNYGLSLKVSAGTGKLTGTFTNTAGGTVVITPLAGIVLQSTNTGRGFFKGTNQSGSFLLK